METKGQISKDRHGNVIILKKTKSLMALIASLVTFGFSFYAIAGGMVLYVEDDLSAGMIFQWFTTISNSITCLAACMITPFAVEGYRKKHFSVPKWVAVFLYMGMVGTTLTMIVSMGFISWVDPELAFGGYNTYLHIVCPVMVLISFFMIESGYLFTVRDAALTVVPAVMYTAVYFIEVIAVGEQNGGWEDLYHVKEFVPLPVAAVAIPAVSFGIAMLIRFINNRRVRRHREQLMSKLIPEGVSTADVKIEMFGLGRYMGKHSDPEYVELYLGVLNMIARQYELKPEELVSPYVRGFFDSFNEKHNES